MKARYEHRNYRRTRQLRRRHPRVRRLRDRASKRLSRFRQATFLAVSLTAFLLLVTGAESQEVGSKSTDAVSSIEAETVQSVSALRELLSEFLAFLPRLAIAFTILLTAWAIFKTFKHVYFRIQGNRQRREGVVTLTQLMFGFGGIIFALTVLVGDIRTLLGSVGLIGIALSWALQQPIESFSGYLLNAFRAYYRIGDRIKVGDVYGDVYRVDFLTTTVWEVGEPGKSVSGAQSTGALITFPNSEVVRANIVNYSRDFPYIWDELVVGIANESELPYTVHVLRQLSEELLGTDMTIFAAQYRQLLRRSGLNYEIEEKPSIYLTGMETWTNCTIRYLVDLRKRRYWSSLLYEKVSAELADPRHAGRIVPAYPNRIVQIVRQ